MNSAMPVPQGRVDHESKRSWAGIAALLLLPFTAIVHHLVFYPQQCIFNAFGPRYDVATIAAWLRGDPSFYVGFVAAVVTYAGGVRWPLVRRLGLAFLLATIPLSMWIWDLPFGERPICRWLHDGRGVLRGRHFYGLALLAWPLLAVWLGRRHDR